MKKIIYLVLLIFIGCCRVLYAQQDSIAKHKSDSAKNVKLEGQMAKIHNLVVAHTLDSLKKADIEKQVSQLSANDKQQRLDLVKELSALKQRDSLRKERQKHQIDSLRKYVKGFAVVPFYDTIFYVYTRTGGFTAQERAEAIGQRIQKLSGDELFKVDSLKCVKTEVSTDIVFKDLLITSVTESDGIWQNTGKDVLAEELRKNIVNEILRHRQETRWQTLLKESLLTILVIAIGILLIFSVNRSLKWVHKTILGEEGWFVNIAKIKNYKLLTAERQLNVLKFIFKQVKWILIILICYLTLSILFHIFPFTRDLSNILFDYIARPIKRIGNAVWHYLPNLFTIVIFIVIFRYTLRFLSYIRTEIDRGELTIPGFYSDWATPTYQIMRVLVLAFLLIVTFPYLPGSNSDIFKSVSVFVGVLVTFGSAGALGNIASGIVMTYTQAFKIGDRVTIDKVTGNIIEKSLLVTRIRTVHNEVVTIPNSKVIDNHTINFSSDAAVKGLVVYTTVTIGYDAPWRQVHQLLIDAALDTPLIEQEPLPYVYQTSLDDYYVSYRINAFTKEPNRQAFIYSGLHQNIQDQFNKAGVEIMSPHYKALRDGNTTTIPADYLPKDYTPPGFVTEVREPK